MYDSRFIRRQRKRQPFDLSSVDPENPTKHGMDGKSYRTVGRCGNLKICTMHGLSLNIRYTV